MQAQNSLPLGLESIIIQKDSPTKVELSFWWRLMELAMIRARVRSGMENARAKGKRIGRPQMTAADIPSAFLRHYPAYKAGRLNVSELARVCGISRTTVYKYLGMVET